MRYPKSNERRGNVEVRLNDDGTLDEVLLYDATGKVLFHLEQMDHHVWWMRLENGDYGDLVVDVRSNAGDDESRAEAERMRKHGVDLDGSRAVADHAWD